MVSPRMYLGIDPGIGGGLAFIVDGKAIPIKMPATERDVYDRINNLGMGGSVVAVIEAIHPAIPIIGKSSMSKLYGSYMALRMALIAARIPFEPIMARVWQRGLDIPPRNKHETTVKWKNRLKAKAQQLYPDANLTLATCDAVLIAEYCRRKHRGLL